MIIYKYTRSSLVQAFLERNTLAFPLYNQLNDPYESTAFIPSLRGTDDIKYRRGPRIIDFRSEYDPPGTSNEFPQGQPFSLSELEDHLRNNSATWLTIMRGTAGILSLTSDPMNVLMWAHYAENHRGVCIGFDKDVLENSIPVGGYWPPDLRNETEKMRRVHYSKARPQYQNSERNLLISAFFTKHSSWSYEKEWRLLRPVEFTEEDTVDLKPLPVGALREVILGLNVTPKTVELVRAACKSYPEVKIFEMFQIKDRYAIDRRILP